MKKALRKILLIAFVLVLTCFLAVSCRKDPPPTEDENTPSDVYIAKDGASEYKIVFGASDTGGGKYAYTFNQAIASVSGITLELSDDGEAEVKGEILLGDTNRQLTKDLKAELEGKAASDSFVWGFAYRDGQFAFYFNNQIAFDKGLEEFKATFLKDGSFVVSSDTWVTKELTLSAYNKEVAEEEERLKAEAAAKKQAELDKRLEAVKAEITNATYKDADFGADDNWLTTYSMPTDKYEPSASITESHPRLFLTKDMVPNIKALLDDPEYKNLADNFWAFADSEDFTGVFKEMTHPDGETYRYEFGVLTRIEARAMAYLLTGHKAYAYEAIHGIKNAMLSYKFTTENHVDVYHGPGEIMYSLAKVYDWCYDVLTETDKKQLISGCVYLLIEAKHFKDEDFVLDANKPSLKPTLNTQSKSDYGLEFNFPPDNHSAVTGHGTGPQFLQYYIAASLAFADEVPSWWDFVGGRFYQEYLPVTRELYKNGYVTQGTANYAFIKLSVNIIPAYLLSVATSNNPYPDYIAECANFMLSHMMPNGNMFETGDGPRPGSGSKWGGYYSMFYYFAALYNDTFSLQAAKAFSDNFESYSGAETLALCASCDKATGKFPDDMPLVTYTESPVGLTNARSSWASDAAVVFMKVGERTLAGHDHADSGTFQIYYKGFLAVSSGNYSRYGSEHHLYYLQATVGMNGLLIYNPAMKLANSWYSGSQNHLDGPSSLEEWLGGKYDVAEITGVQNQSGKYSYLAGDITKSYNASTVDYVGRRMLTVFTGDKKAPMVFFVFDSITSDDEGFKKSFLLHTVKEPTISGTATGKDFTVTPDASGKMTATIVNGQGAMVLQNVYGGDYMHKIGGEGYAYWIGNENEFDGTSASGFNAVDSYTPTDNYENIWGRIEITARGEMTTEMLNVMYVTDSGDIKSMPAALVEDTEGALVGATIGNTCAMFVKQAQRAAEAFSFTTSGDGTMKYFISGLRAGSWNVSINGGTATEYKVTEDGGMLEFSGKVGAVTVTPGSNVLKDGHALINYKLAGGKLPENSPLTYEVGKTYTLPIPTLSEAKFIGWYSDSAYTDKITEIPATATGTFTVYAKFEVYDVYKIFAERENELKPLGATSIYYNDVKKLVLAANTSNNGAWYGHKREGWTEFKGGLFGGISVFDSWGKADGENYYGNNISSDGDGIIYSEWKAEYTENADANNYVLLQLKEMEELRGKSIVLSTGVTMLSDSFTGRFTYKISDSKGKLVPIVFEIVNGQVMVGDTVIATLVKGVTLNITVHIKIVASTETGAFNAADFDGEKKLSLSDFEKKYGTVRYDLYVDGVKAVSDALLISQADQAKITNAAGETSGLATDYLIRDFMCGIASGNGVKGMTDAFDGEEIFAQEYFDIYMSGTAVDLIDIYNKSNVDMEVIKDGHASINYNLAGGKLPDGSPLTYEVGKAYTLPNPTLLDTKFVGWYSDPYYKNQITEIPATATGTFFAYAKFMVYDFYTERDEKLTSAGATSIYYNDVKNLVLAANTSNNGAWYGHKREGWTEYKGELFGGVSVFDSWGKADGENYYGNNISTNGDSIIYSEWKAEYTENADNYNYVLLQMKEMSALRGKSVVFSTGVTMLSDSFTGSFSYRISDWKGKITSVAFEIVNGQIKVGDTVVATLVKGVTANITLHVKIVAPTETGAYNADDFTTLSLSDFEKKYGTVRYDLYVDGVKVATDALLVSQASQALVINADGNTTGLSTDYLLKDILCGYASGGGIKGVTDGFNGEKILAQEYFDIYKSERVVNLYNTVTE